MTPASTINKDHCYRCHGEGKVPVTEIREFYEDERRLVTRYRQVVIGWRECPECGKEDKG